MLFTDKVQISNSTVDDNNVPTEESAYISTAYIENNSRELRNGNGTVIRPDFFIMLPGDLTLQSTDTLEIIEIHGQDPVGDETGIKQIKSIKRIGGRRISHLEILV